jgi:hypothetical protein
MTTEIDKPSKSDAALIKDLSALIPRAKHPLEQKPALKQAIIERLDAGVSIQKIIPVLRFAGYSITQNRLLKILGRQPKDGSRIEPIATSKLSHAD